MGSWMSLQIFAVLTRTEQLVVICVTPAFVCLSKRGLPGMPPGDGRRRSTVVSAQWRCCRRWVVGFS